MTSKTNITGIILAGGKSSRMGRDKGFVLWKNKPFIQHSIDALAPLVDNIIIVSDYLKYDELGYKRIPDYIPEAGPLSGLYSGLKDSKTELNLVLSCDVPLINTNILQKLITVYHKGIASVVCMVDDKIMPLVALYHKNCYQICEVLLDDGERKMMRFLDKLPSTTYLVLDDTEAKSVRNINSPMDLNEIENAN